MKEENKCCGNCFWYRALYLKAYSEFDKLDLGMCKRKEVRQKNGICDNWETNATDRKEKKKQITKTALMASLNRTIKNLTEVGQILREMKEDEG